MPNITPLIEAILSIQGKKGSSHTQLLPILNIDESIFETEMRAFLSIFTQPGRGLELKKVANKYLSVTKSHVHVKIFPEKNHDIKNPINPSLIGTLAIIADNSPCTRPKVHDIMKIDPTQQITMLLELELIVEIGRADSQG